MVVDVRHPYMLVFSFHCAEHQRIEILVNWMVAMGSQCLVVVRLSDEVQYWLTSTIVVRQENTTGHFVDEQSL